MQVCLQNIVPYFAGKGYAFYYMQLLYSCLEPKLSLHTLAWLRQLQARCEHNWQNVALQNLPAQLCPACQLNAGHRL